MDMICKYNCAAWN